MSIKYLELNSAYRNRKLYPSPATFVTEISQSGQRDRINALDPVSNASPILQFNISFQEDASVSPNNVVSNITVVTPISTGTPSLAGTNILQISAVNPSLRLINNFYIGACLSITIAGVTTSRRIVEYHPLGISGVNTVAEVILDVSLPDSLVGQSGFFISNPSPLPTNIATPVAPPNFPPVIKMYIPGGSVVDNYYQGYYLQLIGAGGGGFIAGESRLITAYEGTTRLATLSSATTGDWSSDTNANEGLNFSIRKEPPIVFGAVFPNLTTLGTLAMSTDGRTFQLALPSATQSSHFQGAFLRMIKPFPTSPNISNIVSPFEEERLISKYYVEDGKFVTAVGGTNTFVLSSTSSLENNFYNGLFLTTNFNETYQITSYVGSTRSGTISTNWITAPISYSFRNVVLASHFSTNPDTTNNTYEIEQYTRDNSVPFSYNGSLTSVQDTVCYEVELLNLILPNITLNNSGRGGRPAFYPHMYVELEQVSATSAGGNKGVIYSNNPTAYKMMYRVPMNDTPSPLVSAFIKVDGDSMTHTIKFKPTDSFRFGVYQANGELFNTVVQDYYSPTEPNPVVQISACFAFKRISN